MAENTRSRSELACNKVRSFINQNIRSKSAQIHSQDTDFDQSRWLSRSTEVNSNRPQTNTSKTTLKSQQQLSKSLTSEETQKRISRTSRSNFQNSTKNQSNNVERGSKIEAQNNIPVKKLNKKSSTKLIVMIMVSGTLLGLTQREIIEMGRNWFFVLEDENIFTNIWSDAPVGLNLCFHVFDLKNGKAFYKGAKPELERLGPYCYKAFRKRDIFKWTDKTVEFNERFNLEFNPEESESLDRNIATINLSIYAPLLFAKELLEKFYLKFAGPIVFNIMNVALRSTGEKPIERMSVDEVLNGRKVNIIVLLDKILDPLRKMGLPIPEYEFGGYKLVNQSYGIAALMNHATFGPIEAYRRTEDGKHVGDIVGLHGGRFWPNRKAPCNRLESSDGVFFSRPVTQDELTIFFYISCRLMKFVKEKEHFLYGAYLTRYSFDKNMFTMNDPENHCFCKEGRSLASCEGLNDASNCFLGLPIELSMPSFLYYKNLQKKFRGLNPTEEEFDGYFDIDPYLGSPVNLQIFVQGNLHLSRIPSVPVLANIREIPYPILLIQVKDGIEHRKYLIPVVVFLSNYLRYSSLIWFLGSALLSGVILYRRRK